MKAIRVVRIIMKSLLFLFFIRLISDNVLIIENKNKNKYENKNRL